MKYSDRLQDYLNSTGRAGARFLCIKHNDTNPSMAYHKNGYAHCFSCGANASITDFAAYDMGVENIKQNYNLICKHIEETLGITPEPIARDIPLETRLVNTAALIAKVDPVSRSAYWTYRDADGNPLFYDVRVEDENGKKTVLSISPEFKAKGVPISWYNLDKLAASSGKPIMVHEGAKCAEYAGELLPGFVHTTTNRFVASGAANAPVSLFKNRDVYLYPDNDVPGRIAMATLYQRLVGVAASVTIINTPEELEDVEGADIADCKSPPDTDAAITVEKMLEKNLETRSYEDEWPADTSFVERLVSCRDEIRSFSTDMECADFIMNNSRNQIIYANSIGLAVWNPKTGAFENKDAEYVVTNAIVDFANSVIVKYMLRKLDDVSSENVKKNYQFFNKYLRSVRGAGNVVKAIKIRALRRDEELNPNKDVINCQGITINLKNGNCTNSNPTECFTASTSVRPDNGKPKAFYKFLSDIGLKEGEQEYVLRFLGYCLTGENNAQKFLDLCGTGRNGKGTLLRIMSSIMGSYATVISDDLILNTGNNKNLDPAKLALFGKRFAYAPDLGNDNQSLRLDELKKLVGGDTIAARPLYKTQYTEWQNTAKLCFATNHELKLKDTGVSMRARLRYIKFTKSFAGHEDTNLDEKLKKEAPQILALLLKYAQKYYKEGLPDFPDVIANTGAMIDAQDDVQQFLNSTKPIEYISVVDLWNQYKYWCEDSGVKPRTKSVWRDKMFNLGVKECMYKTQRAYKLPLSEDNNNETLAP